MFAGGISTFCGFTNGSQLTLFLFFSLNKIKADYATHCLWTDVSYKLIRSKKNFGCSTKKEWRL